MAFFETGIPPNNSTTSLASGQSTTALLAEISTLAAGNYEVRWIVGGSTNAVWALEHALSTGITSTSLRDVVYAFTSPNQSALFVQKYTIESGDLLRARITSTVATVAAHISAERLV